MWLVFLLIHLIGLTGYNLVLRKSLVAKTDSLMLAVIMQSAVALPMVFALLFWRPELASYSMGTVLLLCAAIALIVALHITNVQSLKSLEASVFSVIFNLRIIIVTILGFIFLNEAVIPLQIIGGLLIFLGIITVKQKGSKRLARTGLYWAIASAIVISLLGIVEKKLLSTMGYLDYAIPAFIMSAVILWIVLLARDKKIELQSLRQPGAFQLMTLRAISAYGFNLAIYAGALISVANYISSLSVMLTVLFGALLLGERDYLRQKIIAAGLAVLGLTAIFLSRL